MKNLKKLGKLLNNKEQQAINGGANPCSGDIAAKASCLADGGIWVDANPTIRQCGYCICTDGTHND